MLTKGFKSLPALLSTTFLKAKPDVQAKARYEKADFKKCLL